MLKKIPFKDFAVALYIVAAIVMLIIPMPALLLDILLAFDFALSMTIMFGCMFAPEVLDMNFFPTMLLFTTVFRIGLNASSTRLILRTGYAGNVIQTFGNFVGGGDLIIGTIVFLILLIILIVVLAVRKIILDKKKGRSCCGDCSQCGGCDKRPGS